jgi:flagellar hook-associated protein 1 FlgK
MDSMSIAVGALKAAQSGLDIVGNNIANAATEGYHRQRIEFTPAYSSELNGFLLGGGVDVSDIRRIIDNILEKQITQQCALSGQANAELSTLSSIEAALGDINGEGGLGSAMDDLFTAFQNLSADPSSDSLQTQVQRTADAMTSQFRTFGTFLSDLTTSVVDKASLTADKVNELAEQIAGLNQQIQDNSVKGYTTNNLTDERDARINDLADLVGVDTVQRANGTVDVSVGGGWLVIASNMQKIRVSVQADGLLGIAPESSTTYSTELEGGQLGAYFNLNNTSLVEVKDKLDTLARTIMDGVNRYHVQGIGSDGSFTDLVGSSLTDESLSNLDFPVMDGDLYVRVTNSSSGQVIRTRVPVDASVDDLTSMAAKLDAISGISAWVGSGRIHIQSDPGHSFDFLPAVMSPDAGELTGTSSATMSGVYTGSANDEWTFTVVGSGEVGNSDDLSIMVTDSHNNLIATVNVGTGYTAGKSTEIASGVKISLGSGTLYNDDTFDVLTLADSDSSGFLAAVGLNTFFTGNSAENMQLNSSIAESPSKIASFLTDDTTDNTNVLRFSRMQDTRSAALGDTTISGYYQQLVTNVGADVSLKQSRVDNIDAVTKNLKAQREETSGVDINDEAAKMLVFERMFEASAKYLNTVQATMDAIMKLL